MGRTYAGLRGDDFAIADAAGVPVGSGGMKNGMDNLIQSKISTAQINEDVPRLTINTTASKAESLKTI